MPSGIPDYLDSIRGILCRGFNKPRDLFDTMDHAARGFGIVINAQSISENREYIAVVYTIISARGTQFTYTKPQKGRPDGAKVPGAPLFRTRVAIVHTHAAYDPRYQDEVFSPGDIAAAKTLQIPIYAATPMGTLRKYDPATRIAVDLYTDLPYDPSHPLKQAKPELFDQDQDQIEDRDLNQDQIEDCDLNHDNKQ